MGKHSNRSGGFGAPGDKGPRPVRRREPSKVVGKRPVGRRDPGVSAPQGPLEAAPAHLRAERVRRAGRTKQIFAIVGVALLAMVLIGAGSLWAYAKHIERTMQRTVVKKEQLKVDLAPAKPMEPYNLLILGYDKRKGDVSYRTDSMMLARVDPKTKQMWLISIPRDMRAKIPGHGYNKINAAYSFGQEQLAIDAVEELTDQKINHYMGVDFTGFRKVVDAMGGVWIDVPVEINDDEADPSKGNKYSHIDAGWQRLDGNHAITFVRARHQFADQDFSRMKNQQKFLKAAAEQLATKTSIAKIPRIVSTAAPYLSTDMTLMEMLRTAQAMKGAGGSNVYTTTLPGYWKSPYIWPDEAKMKKVLAKFEAGEPFKKKKSTEPTATAEATTTAAAATDPKDVSVTIRNGAGIAGCAKQASSILKARAYNVEDVGNANQFVYDKTLVVYKKDKGAAEQVQAVLVPGTKVVESRGMYSFDTDILVVVGNDWHVSKIPVAPVKTN